MVLQYKVKCILGSLFECDQAFHVVYKGLNLVKTGHYFFFCSIEPVIIVSRLAQFLKSREEFAILKVTNLCLGFIPMPVLNNL